jgi:hypothetical protein
MKEKKTQRSLNLTPTLWRLIDQYAEQFSYKNGNDAMVNLLGRIFGLDVRPVQGGKGEKFVHGYWATDHPESDFEAATSEYSARLDQTAKNKLLQLDPGWLQVAAEAMGGNKSSQLYDWWILEDTKTWFATDRRAGRVMEAILDTKGLMDSKKLHAQRLASLTKPE